MPRQVAPTNRAEVMAGDQGLGPVMQQRMVMQVMNEMGINASVSFSRSGIARALGMQYQGQRDLYTALGYNPTLIFNDYLAKFTRQDIARKIVRAPVEETWRGTPEVLEVGNKDKDDTDFEKAWKELAANKRLRLWNKLFRLDIAVGIGRYGVLFMGFNDMTAENGKHTDKAVIENGAAPNIELLHLTAMTERNAKITTVSLDPTSERFGEPLVYQLNFTTGTGSEGRALSPGSGDTSTVTMAVHWQRVIHVAEGTVENDIWGTPRLEASYDRLDDLLKVIGGASEGYWRQGFPGMHIDIKTGDEYGALTDPDTQMAAMKTQIENYIHRNERVLRTQGVDVKELMGQVADPSKIVEMLFSLLAGATGIPKRILIGSERGELASTQDESNWAKQIETRRIHQVNPVILDQTIQRLIDVGVLPAPKGSWEYVWPDLLSPSDKDRAEVTAKLTEALVKYADSLNAGDVVPFGMFLRSRNFMNFSEEEALQIEAAMEERAKEIEDENEEIRRAEEEAAATQPIDEIDEIEEE